MFDNPNLKTIEALNSPLKGVYEKTIMNGYPAFESDKIKVFLDTSKMSISVIYKETGGYVFENDELPTWELVSQTPEKITLRFIDFNE